jgi:acyl-CoA reductase-like NAD-dependent aldehyde dehydrogenase
MPQLMLIDGQRIPSVTGEYFDVHDPASEELLDQAPMGNEEDARAAIAAANQAFKSWRKVSAHGRVVARGGAQDSRAHRGAGDSADA